MVLVIPSLELRNGTCSRCVQGEPGTEELYTHYSETPDQLIQLWRRENAKSIHITDRDSLENRDNAANRLAIIKLAQSVDIPIALLSSFTTPEECRYWLDNGVYRIIISKLARTHAREVRDLIAEYTASRIVFGILAKKGNVILHDPLPTISDTEFVRDIAELGGTRIFYIDIAWEGSLAGPNLSALQRIAVESGLRVTAAGGIANARQLWELQTLEKYGVDSVVIGRALYENCFPCQKIWRIAEASLEQEYYCERL
jgi:phosphoribosylformimino-5-aminoimidazole carboxamide ribotide isomerase